MTLDSGLLLLAGLGIVTQLAGFQVLGKVPDGLPAGRLSSPERRFLVICVAPFLIRILQTGFPASLPASMPQMTIPIAGWTAPILASGLLTIPLVRQMRRRAIGWGRSAVLPFLTGGSLFIVLLLGAVTSPFHTADLETELRRHETTLRGIVGDLSEDRTFGDQARRELEGELSQGGAAARDVFWGRGHVAARQTLEARQPAFAQRIEAIRRRVELDRQETERRRLVRLENERREAERQSSRFLYGY